ncbi:uncharacterized protein BXZ73DRAFT_107059 [Epithele typhae]|uniref:uncharacterized protein n=1 Tax=Epithele typhae TaxID=378194 RepID=UPI0020082BF0|nr:uncharacterized protein BXZ73DRAFT_107059 [Epithele typhae]KAH9913082.1 hypothetical protein BXZ73DRAFT_107059 [Epithele typhae]
MDQCPVEVLHSIFSYACTDDGSTGRALGLTSRYIAAASRPFLYASVALFGPAQIAAFATLLEGLHASSPSSDTPVLFLYITDRAQSAMRRPPGQPHDQSRSTFTQMRDTFMPTDAPALGLAFSISRLLLAVAPTLRALALLLFHRYHTADHPLSVPLPHLHELTAHTSLLHTVEHVEIVDGAPMFRTPAGQTTYAALRRLHLIQNGASTIRQSVPRVVARIAPRITHLFLARLGPSFMRQGGVHGHRRPSHGAGEEFPATLQRVIVQTLDTSQYRFIDQDLMAQLKELAASDVQRRIAVLEPVKLNVSGVGTILGFSIPDVDFYMKLQSLWEQRLAGGEGVWDVTVVDQ